MPPKRWLEAFAVAALFLALIAVAGIALAALLISGVVFACVIVALYIMNPGGIRRGCGVVAAKADGWFDRVENWVSVFREIMQNVSEVAKATAGATMSQAQDTATSDQTALGVKNEESVQPQGEKEAAQEAKSGK